MISSGVIYHLTLDSEQQIRERFERMMPESEIVNVAILARTQAIVYYFEANSDNRVVKMDLYTRGLFGWRYTATMGSQG